MAIFVAQAVVLAVGVTVFVLAAWGLIVPERLMALVTTAMDKRSGIFIAVGARLVLGAALITAAPASPFPGVVEALGWIALVAAVIVALMGRERIRRVVGWWCRRASAPTTRLWLLVGMAFGGFLVYTVA